MRRVVRENRHLEIERLIDCHLPVGILLPLRTGTPKNNF
jgi:hypothetical protein